MDLYTTISCCVVLLMVSCNKNPDNISSTEFLKKTGSTIGVAAKKVDYDDLKTHSGEFIETEGYFVDVLWHLIFSS